MTIRRKTQWLLICAGLTVLIALAFGDQFTEPVIGQGPSDPPEAGQSALEVSEAVSGGPGFYTRPASAFRPRLSSTEYQLIGPRLSTISGSSFYDAPLDLPNGADITKLVIYYTDNDAAVDLSAEIWRVPLPGRSGEKVSETISTSGSSGSATFVETTNISLPRIDLASYGYYIRLSLPASDDLETNGFRVDYAFDTVLPLILKN